MIDIDEIKRRMNNAGKDYDEWLEIEKEVKRMPDDERKEFYETKAGHILGQICGLIHSQRRG